MAAKRQDGRYQLVFRFGGKQYAVYGKDRKEASLNKLKKIEELQTGRINHENPFLNDYYETFTELRRRRVKEGTLRNQRAWYEACATIMVTNNKTLGEMRIADIKPRDCLLVQQALVNSGKSPQTINDYMAHLSHVFSSAVKDETISRNPCSAVENLKRETPPARDNKHRALSTEETSRFFEAAEDSYYYNLFRLLLQTGLRIGEAGALCRADIDFNGNMLHITKTIVRDEIGMYMIGNTTKTDASKRDIPMNPIIKTILKDQIARNNIIKMQGTLFTLPEGGLLREYSVNREIKRICTLAEIEKFTSHAFRATFATRFIEQRPQDYKILSDILGHANVKITLDLYTHVMKENKVKAMDGITIAM